VLRLARLFRIVHLPFPGTLDHLIATRKVPMAESKTKTKAASASKRASKKADRKAPSDKKSAPRRRSRSAPATPAKLSRRDALAMAEALVEMVNDGASDPVAFFVSPDDPLGRELIELQGHGAEASGMVPVVLDSAAVRRYAMLCIADELLWRNAKPR
jgi:hypothetical protein